jgi:hypothetical protein
MEVRRYRSGPRPGLNSEVWAAPPRVVGYSRNRTIPPGLGTARSCALSRRDGGEGRPALLDLLASAVRADNVAFLVIDEGEDLVEEHLAVDAEEFVVGHAGPLLRRADTGILGLVPGAGKRKKPERRVGV